MPFPPWTRELLSGSLDDVTKKLQSLDTVRELQSRASALLGDLPIAAARGLDRILQETRKGTDHLRRWARRQTTLNLTAINGSGVYFHSSLEGSPMPYDAAEKMLRSGDYFSLDGGLAGERIEHRLTAAVAKHVDCEVLMVASIPAAMLAVAASVPKDGSILIPRTASVRLSGGMLIPDLLAAAGRDVHEIGSIDQCLPEDWNAVLRGLSPASMAVTIRWPDAHQIPAAHEISPSQANCQQTSSLPEGVKKVQYVPYGTFFGLGGDEETSSGTQAPGTQLAASTFLAHTTLLDATVVSSNWLTIVPTHALIGGPAGALILGTKAAVDSVRETPVWPALKANLHDKAALAMALETVSPDQMPRAALKVLLAVSVDNLQSRAERLVTQLAGETAFQSCRITQEPARIGLDLPAIIPSRQVCIVPKTNCQRLQERLLADSPALVTERRENELKLDLRWIPSHLDSGLISLLAEHESAAAPSASNQPDLSGNDSSEIHSGPSSGPH